VKPRSLTCEQALTRPMKVSRWANGVNSAGISKSSNPCGLATSRVCRQDAHVALLSMPHRTIKRGRQKSCCGVFWLPIRSLRSEVVLDSRLPCLFKICSEVPAEMLCLLQTALGSTD